MLDLIKRIHPLAGDGVILAAVAASFFSMQSWQDVAEERIRALEAQQATVAVVAPEHTKRIAVLEARLELADRNQAELKTDIVDRMNRIDSNLTALTNYLRAKN